MRQIGNLGLIGTLLVGMLLAACGTTQTQLSGQAGVKLDPTLGVFIAVPADPADPDYAGTGKYLAYALAEDLGKRGISIGIGKEHATQEQNLAAAKQQGAAYLMVADITDWQSHATQLDFVPSSAAFTMTVLNVADGSQLRSDDLVKQGSHISFTGSDPKDQMKSAMEHYVKDVYPGGD